MSSAARFAANGAGARRRKGAIRIIFIAAAPVASISAATSLRSAADAIQPITPGRSASICCSASWPRGNGRRRRRSRRKCGGCVVQTKTVDPVHGQATLIIKIETFKKNGELGKPNYYRLVRLKPTRTVSTVAFRLQKPDGKFHDVRIEATGYMVCDCEDWNYRRRNTAGSCKHCEALKALGLIAHG